MQRVEKKKYERAVPQGRTRLVEIPAHGRTVDDVVGILEGLRHRDGNPRCYVDSNGRLIVAVQNWES
jgi:hypothetical protein